MLCLGRVITDKIQSAGQFFLRIPSHHITFRHYSVPDISQEAALPASC
jgi:hypothetical protein